MSKNKKHSLEFIHFCGIDIGSGSVRCVIARPSEKPGDLPRILGTGEEASRGMRKGVVIDPVQVAQSIDGAVAKAEQLAGLSVESATFSIGGSLITTHDSKGVAAVLNPEKVDSADAQRAYAAASLIQLPPNHIMLDLVELGYSVDGQDKTHNPVGMSGSRIELTALAISTSESSYKALLESIKIANISCDSVQPAARVAAEAILSIQQRERGVLYVDIGAQTTSAAVFEEQELRRISVVPSGSENITNDLAIGLQITLEQADEVKRLYSSGFEQAQESQEVELDTESDHFKFKFSDVQTIVEARTEEIFEKVVKKLKKSGQHARLPAGVVLGGAGSLLPQIEIIAKGALRLSSKKAVFIDYETSTGEVLGPEWACAIGLMLFDDRSFSSSVHRNGGAGSKLAKGAKIAQRLFGSVANRAASKKRNK